ncbi:helix-turn-helix domain-containing protein [Agromyces laixinhei]|uniref:helix-turn-helix domain-containing protein n=1 Tax=Agromyces laixinhei TaxID=2585717 RepID=UPI0012ED4F14|nr:hypothetical protein [Agromyces laixinhei]
MDKLLTAAQAAEVAKRSHSTINRDAAAGKLPTAMQFPGYKGARLFDEIDVLAYAEAEAETPEARS